MKKTLLLVSGILVLSILGPLGAVSSSWTARASDGPAFYTLNAAPASYPLSYLGEVPLLFLGLMVALGVLGYVAALSPRQSARIAGVFRAMRAVKVPRVRAWHPPLATLLAGLFLTGGAVAQGTAPAATPQGVDFGWLTPFIPAITSGLLSVSLAALGYLATYLRQKTQLIKSDRLQKALMIIEDLIFKKVRELTEGSIKYLRQASADGSLTKEEAAQAARTAIVEVWSTLPQAIKNILVHAAGSEQAAQDAYLKLNVESAVKTQKRFETDSISGTYVTSSARHAEPAQPTVPAAKLAEARARIGIVR